MTLRSAVTAIALRVGATLLSATMFVWIAVVNGYPLIFNDTGRYVDGGIRHFIPSQGPIFYGIFMIPLHLDGWSLWPVVVAQCLVLAYVLRLTLRVFNLLDERTFLALSAFLAAFTGAPWFASLIMPDFFTAISVLTLFALFRGWERLGRWERVFLIGLVLLALASHITHIFVGLSFSVLFVALSLLERVRNKATPTMVASLPVIALCGVIGMNVAAKGRPLVTQDGNVFLFARAFADGPGYEYMRDNCGQRAWHLCEIYTTLPHDVDSILWAPQRLIWSVASGDEVRAEAGDIVRGAVLAHPSEMLAAALHNAFTQLLIFRSGVDFDSWGANDSYAAIAIHHFFPREYSQFMHSLQQESKLDATVVNRLYSFVVIFSLIGLVILLVLMRFDVTLAEFILVIAVALAANAFATGAFSSVHDRYQARIIWLVPLVFVISFLVYRRQRDARLAPLADKPIMGKT